MPSLGHFQQCQRAYIDFILPLSKPADLSHNAGLAPRSELKTAAAYLLWPVVGFVAAVVGGWLELKWLAPLGVGGLFCHYWLDGRIWIRRSLHR